MEKICSKCRLLLDRSMFRPDPTLKSGLRSQCKTCNLNYSREYESTRKSTRREKTKQRRIEHPLDIIYFSMVSRCHNVNNDSYSYYGGRGIYVCEEWLASKEALYKDMGPRPSMRHSIDRIDNNGPYSAENCRWVTSQEQMSNTRRNRFLTLGDRTDTLSGWARSLDISYQALSKRLSKWPLEKALTTPKTTKGV